MSARQPPDPQSSLPNEYRGTLLLGIKRPGHEAGHSLPSSAEFKELVELHVYFHMRLQDVHTKNLHNYKLWVLLNQVNECKKIPFVTCHKLQFNRRTGRFRAVFLNRQAAARYRALTSNILGCEEPEETIVRYKNSLVQLITNLNVILYLSTCHTVYISVLIPFMIMP